MQKRVVYMSAVYVYAVNEERQTQDTPVVDSIKEKYTDTSSYFCL